MTTDVVVEDWLWDDDSPEEPEERELSYEERMVRKRAWYVFVTSIVGVIVIAIIFAVTMGGKEKPISVQTEKVSRQTITEVVQATGKIQPETMVKISPEVPGEIVSLPFKEGDHVRKGQLIAKIKPTTFQEQYAAAAAQLASAKALTEQQNAALIQSKQDLARAERLKASHLLSEQDFDAMKAKHDASVAALSSSKYQAEAAESQMRQFRESLNKTSVVAPMDGVITSLISQLGEKVAEMGQDIFPVIFKALGSTASILVALLGLLIVPVISFHFMRESNKVLALAETLRQQIARMERQVSAHLARARAAASSRSACRRRPCARCKGQRSRRSCPASCIAETRGLQSPRAIHPY